MGKKRVIAETGAGQHGVATATAAALFGFQCRVYMGAEDIRRQRAERLPHACNGCGSLSRSTTGSKTLRDATNEAMREWMGHVGRHALHHRQRGRTASVSHDRTRLSIDHRPIETRAAVPSSRSGDCRMWWWHASAAGATRRGSSIPLWTMPCRADRRRGRRARSPKLGEHAASLSFGQARRLARQLQLCLARR